MKLSGVLKKEHVEILGVNLKRSEISRGVQEKLMWNFHGFWFLTLEFAAGVQVSHNFVEFPGVKACFLQNF